MVVGAGVRSSSPHLNRTLTFTDDPSLDGREMAVDLALHCRGNLEEQLQILLGCALQDDTWEGSGTLELG
jgi:hypothetical protein